MVIVQAELKFKLQGRRIVPIVLHPHGVRREAELEFKLQGWCIVPIVLHSHGVRREAVCCSSIVSRKAVSRNAVGHKAVGGRVIFRPCRDANIVDRRLRHKSLSGKRRS